MAVIVLLTWSNCTGLKTGKAVQNLFTLTKIAALLGLVLLGIGLGANSTAMAANFNDWWSASMTQPPRRRCANSSPRRSMASRCYLSSAPPMVGSLFSADAWNNITFTAGEVKNPQAATSR